MKIMTETEFVDAIHELTVMAEKGNPYTVDSFAVLYALMVKMGDRTAETVLSDLKNLGMPKEWASLVDGVCFESSDVEKLIKSFVGVTLNNTSLSKHNKSIKRKIEVFLYDLSDMVLHDAESADDYKELYRLMALYSLSGADVSKYEVGTLSDFEYAELPIYVKWIEKYIWG